MYWLPLFFLPILSNVASTLEFRHNTTNDGCSNHCSQQDVDLRCWNTTFDYMCKGVVNQLRDWVIVQIDIDQWNRRHIEKYNETIDLNITAKSALNQMKHYLKEKNEFLSPDTLQTVVTALMEQVTSHSSQELIAPPEFFCPLPCNYKNRLWQYLFIASAVLNVALALAVIPFVIISSKRDSEKKRTYT